MLGHPGHKVGGNLLILIIHMITYYIIKILMIYIINISNINNNISIVYYLIKTF